MAIQKLLHELLKEDQEPFHLNNYIADRQCQLKRLNSGKPKSLPIKKRNSIVESSPIAISKRNLCRHACFLSFHASPDVIKSPFPSFLSPAKSPCRTQNAITNSPVFLEAALKIQKQQSPSYSKPKSQIKKLGLGLFSSILKKLKDRKRSRNGQIENSRKFEVKREEFLDARRVSDVAIFGSMSNSRLSSAGWSEKETSISSFGSEDSEELDFETEISENCASDFCEMSFCSSPHTPFRFSLQRSPSSGVCTPIFSSPAASPSNRKEQKIENFNVNSLGEFAIEEDHEDEKEQSSPVSVLDPPFENEDDEHESLDEEDYDVECSFAIVQRSKKQLLSKLCRLEKLVELDPIELEQRMLDDEEENEEAKEAYKCDKLLPAHRIFSIDLDVDEVLRKSDISRHRKVPRDMKRLISDLIAEEVRGNEWLDNREIMVKRVCRKLNCWKEVESNTIDMMVEMDLRNEVDEWKVCQEQREETGFEIEVAILGILVGELTQDLVLKLRI